MIVQCPHCRSLVDVKRLHRLSGSTNPLPVVRAGFRCGSCNDVVEWHVDEDPTVQTGASPLVFPSSGAPHLSLPTFSTTTFLHECLAKLAAADDAERALHQEMAVLVNDWKNWDRHKTIVQKAGALGALSFLGQLYRLVQEREPTDDAARRGKEAIIVHAMSTMTPLAVHSTAKNTKRIVYTVLFLLVAGALAMTFVMITQGLDSRL